MIEFDRGSFRDPAGSIFYFNDGVYRTINKQRMLEFRELRESGVLASLIKDGWLIDSEEVCPSLVSGFGERAPEALVKHRKLEVISYPYEWSFSQLKDAALFHLDFHLKLLENGWSLTDATAYNVQFHGESCRPIFIDLLSIRPYQDGEYWLGQRQFCEQFLNPLLLQSKMGVRSNSWYRGALEGISIEDMAKLLPWSSRFSWVLLSNIILPNYFQKKSLGTKRLSNTKAKSSVKRPFPKQAYVGLLKSLRNFIAKLFLGQGNAGVWENYEFENFYSDAGRRVKEQVLEEFCKSISPSALIDMGCNSGHYSQLALEFGSKSVVGFDFDSGSLNLAYCRAKENQLRLIPLYMDACNPSPSIGWDSSERKGIKSRVSADAVIAFAIIHHLAIGRNIPLEQVIDWLLSFGDSGIIEFVGKEDISIKEMLALREDVFPDYTYDNFINILAARRKVVKEVAVEGVDRVLVWYEKE
ncbi:class I SAM-dependent methyltransferase [Microbulbifer aggregans]|uniref:class I SAM-dependent methyltransferase n=1 Tax=Microbulbifer aggregans TaxID=1769779 RepID=UPI001CFE5321|nr:class I SAM-dependent methyltransferase [Microbulbifer aggregans]